MMDQAEVLDVVMYAGIVLAMAGQTLVLVVSTLEVSEGKMSKHLATKDQGKDAEGVVAI